MLRPAIMAIRMSPSWSRGHHQLVPEGCRHDYCPAAARSWRSSSSTDMTGGKDDKVDNWRDAEALIYPISFGLPGKDDKSMQYEYEFTKA